MIRKIINKLLRKNHPQEDEIDFLISQGLKIGKNFRNNSVYLFDTLFP